MEASNCVQNQNNSNSSQNDQELIELMEQACKLQAETKMNEMHLRSLSEQQKIIELRKSQPDICRKDLFTDGEKLYFIEEPLSPSRWKKGEELENILIGFGLQQNPKQKEKRDDDEFREGNGRLNHIFQKQMSTHSQQYEEIKQQRESQEPNNKHFSDGIHQNMRNQMQSPQMFSQHSQGMQPEQNSEQVLYDPAIIQMNSRKMQMSPYMQTQMNHPMDQNCIPQNYPQMLMQDQMLVYQQMQQMQQMQPHFPQMFQNCQQIYANQVNFQPQLYSGQVIQMPYQPFKEQNQQFLAQQQQFQELQQIRQQQKFQNIQNPQVLMTGVSSFATSSTYPSSSTSSIYQKQKKLCSQGYELHHKALECFEFRDCWQCQKQIEHFYYYCTCQKQCTQLCHDCYMNA